METRREKIKKAAARRRAKESFPAMTSGPTPAAGANRKYLFVVLGSLILALVAFFCGVQMGKNLSILRGLDDSWSKTQTQKELAPPFRLMERGKEPLATREGKPRSPEAEEARGGKTGGPPRPAPKGPSEKISDRAEHLAPPVPLPEEKTTAPPKGKYTLQVGAYTNSLEAQELVNQLKSKGYEAYQITGSAAAKGTLHRVRVGHFQSLQEARQFAQTFEKKENMKTIISSVQNP